MQTRLTITANHRPETLERLLRVIRHRGFEVVDLQAKIDGKQVQVTAEVRSERAIDLLVNQLVKLPDVAEVEVIK
ncbi:acetolactate synthase 2 small subunit [Haemophilus paracuniculus]|uniref:Acetolactate synthase 2 small subunit n=1 Tax=Haemophilus paracuniculus TaxID=734 RepID=A0A1T0AVF1_9PAST|nr:acetolactate synthase 2 small subunit [Haemophilus paracuniculus]OOS00769.1 acetolactate synthase 2 small subunit [Haemophilus paracuniculus]